MAIATMPVTIEHARQKQDPHAAKRLREQGYEMQVAFRERNHGRKAHGEQIAMMSAPLVMDLSNC